MEATNATAPLTVEPIPSVAAYNQAMRPRNSAGIALAAILFLTIWAGCGSGGTSAAGPETTRTPALSAYSGSVDEVIGPEGPLATDFADAEYRQLRPPDAILPVYDPAFLDADETDLPDGELVIGLKINGDARAYPAGLLYQREMVNDTVGGLTVLVTWCPLCYTALVHDRRVNGAAAVFGNQGALYRGAMTWFDHATGSVWSQPLGAAIAGPRVGAGLELVPSQLTTWGQWRAANPDSRVLHSDIPAMPYRGRTPGSEHVVGVVVGDQALAWPYPAVLDAGALDAHIGGIDLAIGVDAETGAIRAVALNRDNTELPVIIAYRWAWEKLYPNGQVDKGRRVQ